MDLGSGAKRLIITLKHTGKAGESKVVPQCKLPLTAKNAVSMIITDLAVFNFENDVLTLIELMPGASLEEVRNKTEATFVEKLS
jgi:3-oxoacid CoA-transferase